MHTEQTEARREKARIAPDAQRCIGIVAQKSDGRTSRLQFSLQNLADERGVRLTLGELHHLTLE